MSGGEKRRVSIGVHLIDNPMLVFLDEPTSGLDSFQALAVMDTLKTMAAKADRTVVVSQTQPTHGSLAHTLALKLAAALCTKPPCAVGVSGKHTAM